MKNSIGIHLGANFIECFAKSKAKTFFKRYFLTHHNEIDAIKDFILSLDLSDFSEEVFITSKWAERTIEKRIGSSLAMLVTEGFQNWPSLRQPVFQKKYSLSPFRMPAIVPPDLIFGLSERCSAKGDILVQPKLKELEFIESKLELMGVKNIAIGCLHSNKNSENEEFIANYFREKNYKVFCSHQISQNENEVARWWRSAMEAYVVEVFEEQYNSLRSLLADHNLKTNIISNRAELCENPLLESFAVAYGHSASLAANFPRHDLLVYFGLEQFLSIFPKENAEIFESKFGPISVHHKKQQKLSLQPTQLLGPNEWKIFDFLDQEIGFDPGPMFLGRSLAPCVLDLLFINDQLKDLSSLSSSVKQNSQTRILDAFYTFTRSSLYEKRLEEFVQKIFDIFIKRLASDLLSQAQDHEKIIFTGPLAKTMYFSLVKLLPNLSIELDDNSAWIDSYACSTWTSEGTGT